VDRILHNWTIWGTHSLSLLAEIAFWQETAMSELKTGYFLARTAIEPIDRKGSLIFITLALDIRPHHQYHDVGAAGMAWFQIVPRSSGGRLISRDRYPGQTQ
jgi:hypothetical protein